MKRFITILAFAILGMLLIMKCQQVNTLNAKLHSVVISDVVTNSYKEYYEATEKLLTTLEWIDNLNDLEWGDNICEYDVWYDYMIAKDNIVK